MLFNSYVFLFIFFPVSVVGYYVLGRFGSRAGCAWLAGCSVVFYAWAGLGFTAILLASVAGNYLAGLATATLVAKGNRRGALVLVVCSVTTNLLALGYFKYMNFFVQVASDISGLPIAWTDIILPVGISFFTFTQIAFQVDTYQGRAQRTGPLHYLLFVTYFPHLIAGPILHHAEMLPQFQRARTFRPDAQALAVGLSVFIIGLAKKLLLADSLGGYADVVFLPQHLPGLDTPAVWRGVLAYTLQIYFDFSAYCDMAIGASRMFNITLPANFESPYKSCSIIDFWRRWHITLSRFLRDYLYIPLGGNRLGAGRRYANLIITMLLGGLWHGAGWNFIIWGALHGFYLSVNHLWAQRVRRRLPAWSGWVLTFSAVMLAWVFFRAPDVSTACALLRKMAGLDQPPLLHPTNWHALAGDPQQALVLAVGLLIALALPNLRQIMGGHDLVLGAPGLPAARPWRRFLWQPSFGWAVTLAGSFALSLLYLSRVTQFLYFQF